MSFLDVSTGFTATSVICAFFLCVLPCLTFISRHFCYILYSSCSVPHRDSPHIHQGISRKSSKLTAISSSQIDKHILHYLHPTQRTRLSTSEIQYATTHQNLLHAHYHSSFLAQFPVGLQKLDDTAGGIAMVEVPDAEKAVFVRGLRSDPVRVSVEGTDMDFQVGRGEIVVVRWSAVKSAVEDGDLECV